MDEAPPTSASGTTPSAMTKRAASTGASDEAPMTRASHRSSAKIGAVIANAFNRPPKVNSTASAAMSRRSVSRPMPERRRRSSSSAPGTPTASATLSCGHACTQSRQNVQSRFPTLNGRKSPSSQPRCLVSGRPLMQSNVRHVLHVSGWRTRSSSGDTVEATKLNWPMGHKYLQNVAPVKTRSTDSAATK